MPAATATRPVVLLRGALLLAGLLAVILGLLGMHVLVGSHGMHDQAASAPAHANQTPSASAPAGQDTTAQDSGHPAGHGTHNSTGRDSIQMPDEVPPSCVCQGGCAEKQTVHAGCTPSPAGASLSAPQPGSTFLEGESWTAVRADLPSGYAYLPGTPTPRDLSISRT